MELHELVGGGVKEVPGIHSPTARSEALNPELDLLRLSESVELIQLGKVKPSQDCRDVVGDIELLQVVKGSQGSIEASHPPYPVVCGGASSVQAELNTDVLQRRQPLRDFSVDQRTVRTYGRPQTSLVCILEYVKQVSSGKRFTTPYVHVEDLQSGQLVYQPLALFER